MQGKVVESPSSGHIHYTTLAPASCILAFILGNVLAGREGSDLWGLSIEGATDQDVKGGAGLGVRRVGKVNLPSPLHVSIQERQSSAAD